MIYFIRHGSTDWNEHINALGQKDPKFQGRANIPLNQKGIQQALVMAEMLKGKEFDRVICSPLIRARQTCELIYHGKTPIETDDRLIERDFGKKTGKTQMQIDDFQQFCNRYTIMDDKTAESIIDVEKRVFSLLDELKENPNQEVLIVSHGGVGCVVMSYFKGIPENGDYLSFLMPHGKPLILDFKDLEKRQCISSDRLK